MRKNRFYILTMVMLLSFVCSTQLFSANNDWAGTKHTYQFAIKGADTLRLDKYEVQNAAVATVPKPVMLFAFGGGFKTGSRDADYYIPYFHFLAEQGIVVVSTDYRTGLKNMDVSKMSSPMGFSTSLLKAIAMAVEDFYDATTFIVKHSSEWNIDPKLIIANGSSAGAITALQAVYERTNHTQLSSRLPEGFKYAGAVSFAGAVCSLGIPAWKETPCPILFFHGNADKQVPFDKAVINNMGLWGSHFLAGQLTEMKVPHYFYMVEEAGHEMASVPMTNERDEIMSFIHRLVINHESVMLNMDETVPGKAAEKKDFTFQDYIINNSK
jgi:para-nitrobenzyl esterase